MKTFPKLILAMVALLPGLALAQSVKPTVAIVPTVNTSGDKYADMVDRQKKAADRIQAEELAKRGYEVIPAERVVAALKALEIDLADEENHNRATLIRLGKELGVDTIAFTVVTDT